MKTPALIACAALAAALLPACTPPQQSEEKMAQQCKVWRSYLPNRDYNYVLEECGHQLGKEYCTRCLRE